METMGNQQDEESKSMLEQVQVENRERYDYRRFLQRFSVLREEMQIDPDSFDYNFLYLRPFSLRQHAVSGAAGIQRSEPD